MTLGRRYAPAFRLNSGGTSCGPMPPPQFGRFGDVSEASYHAAVRVYGSIIGTIPPLLAVVAVLPRDRIMPTPRTKIAR